MAFPEEEETGRLMSKSAMVSPLADHRIRPRLRSWTTPRERQV